MVSEGLYSVAQWVPRPSFSLSPMEPAISDFLTKPDQPELASFLTLNQKSRISANKTRAARVPPRRFSAQKPLALSLFRGRCQVGLVAGEDAGEGPGAAKQLKLRPRIVCLCLGNPPFCYPAVPVCSVFGENGSPLDSNKKEGALFPMATGHLSPEMVGWACGVSLKPSNRGTHA